MPVGLDRFLRVVSRGKYASKDLYEVRKEKVWEVVMLADKSLDRLKELDVEQVAEYEDQMRHILAKLEEAKKLVDGEPTMEQVRTATAMLDPIKDLARDMETRAKKLAKRVEQLREVDKQYDTEQWKEYEREGVVLPHQDWDTARWQARDAMIEMPTGVGGLVDQIAEISAMIKRLPKIRDAVIAYAKKKDIKSKREYAERYAEMVPDECAELLSGLGERKTFLEGMLDKMATTQKQVYQSRAQSVVAAIRLLDKGMARAGEEGQALLKAVKKALKVRAQGLLQRQSNVSVTNLKSVLGEKKASTGAKMKYLSLLEAGGIPAITKLPVDTPDIREEDLMELILQVAFGAAGLDGKTVKHEYHEAQIEQMNDKEWKPIKKEVQIEYNGKPVKVKSKIIPAGNLGSNFDKMDGKGVCSHDTKQYKTTTNLAATELTNKDGEVLFQGLRHGINSAYGITSDALKEMPDDELKTMVKDLLSDTKIYNELPGNDDEKAAEIARRIKTKFWGDSDPAAEAMRKKANLNRSMDIVVAALVRNKSKFDQALAHPDREVEVNLSSMSLVTPDVYRRGEGDEAKMLREQMEAWEKLSAEPQPRKVTVKNPKNGELVEVTIRIEVTAFNFGVNAGAVTGLNNIPGVSGWGTSNEYNSKAMDRTLGTKEERKRGLGGRVGRWLAKEAREIRELEQNGDVMGLMDPSEVTALIKKRKKNREIVEKLATQIADMWDKSTYKSQGKEPYKMVSRLAVLTYKMGDDTAFNCKSGKDRTGMVDSEAKLLALQIDLSGDVPEPDHEPDEVEKRNRYSMTVNSGNHEMQQYNTGHMGYKLEGVDALDESLPDDKAVESFRGSSKFTKA